jgi:hypothetical protein
MAEEHESPVTMPAGAAASALMSAWALAHARAAALDLTPSEKSELARMTHV